MKGARDELAAVPGVDGAAAGAGGTMAVDGATVAAAPRAEGATEAPGADRTGAADAPDSAAPGTTPQGEAWGALARTHAAISGRLQEALAAADFPPLPWYEMLATVAGAPEQRMRMGELAEALVITRGGLTKLLDRLVKAGLMERTFCESDRRVSYATLLPAGAALLEEMRPVVVAELDAAFSANLSERQADELRALLERVRVSACNVA